MHRFKVNSLQKLLIHINFLLAFSVLFCSHSAFGQPSVKFDNIDKDPNAVDLGLSVMWAAYNVPDPNNSSTSYYVTYNTALNTDLTNFSVSRYWKLPDNNQISDLINLTFSYTKGSSNNITYIVSGKNSGKNNTVSFPETNYYTWKWPNLRPGEFPHKAYFWSKDKGTPGFAYRFKAEVDNNSAKVENTSTTFTWYIPIRPVIDTVKVKIIGVVSDDPYVSITPKEQVLPEGAGFEIVADGGNCYEFVRWDDNDVNNTSARRSFTDVRNGKVYKAIFKKKKYSVSAYKKYGDSDAELYWKDENLECGQYATISVSIDNCYVFQGWEGPGITGRLAAGQNNNGYSCQVDNSVSPAQAKLTIPNIDSNTQLNRDYTAYFSTKTTNIRATTDSNKGWVGLNVWK